VISAVIVRGWDRLVHLFARIAYLAPSADPDRWDVEHLRDIPYRETGKRAHLLDVYRPHSASPRPVVLYVHGGGWAMLSKDTHRVMALAFASRGYVVFNANYRLGPKHRYPAPIEDACAALEWVHEHAREHGGDPDRIAIAGESAGANLVAALAYVATHPRPEPFARRVFDRNVKLRACLPIYGMLDMHDLGRFDHPRLGRVVKIALHRAAAAYVGRPVRERAALSPLASPLRLLEEPDPEGSRPLPPFFAAVGTADPLYVDSKRLETLLGERGVPCVLSVHPHEIHGFNAMIWRREARRKWRNLFDFLERWM
jgi:acetyl esterase